MDLSLGYSISFHILKYLCFLYVRHDYHEYHLKSLFSSKKYSLPIWFYIYKNLREISKYIHSLLDAETEARKKLCLHFGRICTEIGMKRRRFINDCYSKLLVISRKTVTGVSDSTSTNK